MREDVEMQQLEPWHVPLLVMAGIAAPIWIVGLIKGRQGPIGGQGPLPAPPPDPKREGMRTTTLAVLTALLLVIFVWAIGDADKLATVASAVTAIVGVSMTLQSHMERQRMPKDEAESQTTGADEKTTSPLA